MILNETLGFNIKKKWKKYHCWKCFVGSGCLHLYYLKMVLMLFKKGEKITSNHKIFIKKIKQFGVLNDLKSSNIMKNLNEIAIHLTTINTRFYKI